MFLRVHTYFVDLVDAASLPAFSLICLFNCSISFLYRKQNRLLWVTPALVILNSLQTGQAALQSTQCPTVNKIISHTHMHTHTVMKS